MWKTTSDPTLSLTNVPVKDAPIDIPIAEPTDSPERHAYFTKDLCVYVIEFCLFKFCLYILIAFHA